MKGETNACVYTYICSRSICCTIPIYTFHAHSLFYMRSTVCMYVCRHYIITVEPHLLQTPLNCRYLNYVVTFICPDNSAYSTNIKLPLKMRTPCYSTLQTAPCAPMYTYNTRQNSPDGPDTSCYTYIQLHHALHQGQLTWCKAT